MFTVSEIARFWSRVSVGAPDECWIWRNGRISTGYGQFYLDDGSPILAHRMALQIKMGRSIFAKMYACHSCDNPPCCNPDHLREGTSRDNRLDAKRKGRDSKPPRNPHLRGERAVGAVLNEDAVRLLLWDRVGGMTLAELHKRYGVTPATISALCNGLTWKHLFGTDGYPTLMQVMAGNRYPWVGKGPRRKHHT